MLRNVLTAIAILMASTVILTAQVAAADAEAAAWEAAQASGASEGVFAFIEAYPNGTFTKEAKALMIDLLWVELETNSPEPEAEEEAPETEDLPEALVVTFSAPLTQGTPEIVGQSIEELIAGSPLFPPIDGLPEELWETQSCTSCHDWQQDNLCTQANTYLTETGAENLVKPHPYGGSFKQNLAVWARDGCE
jgi:hypothetical protein